MYGAAEAEIDGSGNFRHHLRRVSWLDCRAFWASARLVVIERSLGRLTS